MSNGTIKCVHCQCIIPVRGWNVKGMKPIAGVCDDCLNKYPPKKESKHG